jgi:hypothetical protein
MLGGLNEEHIMFVGSLRAKFILAPLAMPK